LSLALVQILATIPAGTIARLTAIIGVGVDVLTMIAIVVTPAIHVIRAAPTFKTTSTVVVSSVDASAIIGNGHTQLGHNMKNSVSLEKSIKTILREAKQRPITLKYLITTLSGKGRYLILMLLSLPFCQPIPLPGLSTIFGLLIVFFGVSITFGKHFMLSETLLKRKVSHKVIQSIATKILWIVKKINPLLHARLTFFTLYPAFRILNGLIIVLLGMFLALPLPIPLTNLIPGWIIFLMALGLLEDDGVLILINYCLLAAVIVLVLYLVVFPMLKVPVIPPL
jgi:hypothetical protein